MKKMLFTYTLLCLLQLTVGCGTKPVKTEKLVLVKKVAVLGFDVIQAQPLTGTQALGLLAGSSVSNNNEYKISTEADHVEQIYNETAAKLNKKTNWQVTKLVDIKKNANYLQLYKIKTEGLQMAGAPIPARYEHFRAKGVLGSWSIITSEHEKLKQIAKELGVDAIVLAKATVHLNKSSGMLGNLMSGIKAAAGKGEFKPLADLEVIIIEAASGDKILIKNIEGPQVSESERNAFGMGDLQKLNVLAQKATALAVDKMMSEFNFK
jgi:hypothetical protein